MPKPRPQAGSSFPIPQRRSPPQGEVIAVGPGGRDDKRQPDADRRSRSGDRVLFGKWSGTEVKLDGVDYLIMKESDIMGVLDRVGPPSKKAA